MNELEELEQEELDAKMLETPSPIVSAPNVPKTMPGKERVIIIMIVSRVSNPICLLVKAEKEDDEEAELRALQASMAL